MNALRSRLALGVSLGCLVVVGCGRGGDEPDRPDVPAEQASGGEEEGADATILDVLHLCNHVTFNYEGGQPGAEIGELYWSGKVVWNDRTFTVTDTYVVDEGTDKAIERTIELEATVSEDLERIEKLAVVIGGKGPKELQTYHEEYTWIDIGIQNMYRNVKPNWKDYPGCGFAGYYQRAELDTHVPTWQIKATDSAGKEWSTDRAMLIDNHMPYQESSLSIKVSFRRE